MEDWKKKKTKKEGEDFWTNGFLIQALHVAVKARIGGLVALV